MHVKGTEDLVSSKTGPLGALPQVILKQNLRLKQKMQINKIHKY